MLFITTMLESWDGASHRRAAAPKRGFAACVLSGLLALAAPAAAQAPGRRDPLMPIRLDGHLAVTWDGAFGLGARADLPLISGTFRYSGRDELALSLGADVTFVSFAGERAMEGLPTALLQWCLGVSERFVFAPELGLVARITKDDDGLDVQLRPNVGFGARYFVHRSFGLAVRLGWPIGLSVGAVF